MNTIILEESMFDDGSLDCVNFVVATQNEYSEVISWEYFQVKFPELVNIVKSQFYADKSYCRVELYNSYIYNELILEVQWS